MISVPTVAFVAVWVALVAAAIARVADDRWRTAQPWSSPATDAAGVGRFSWLEPLAIGAIAPALLFPSPTRLLVLAVVPLLWWSARRATGRVMPSTPMNISIGLLAAMTAVSVAVTPDIHNSLGKVSGMVLGMLVFIAGVRWTSTSARWRTALGLFLLAGAGLALVGLLGTNWFGKFGALGPLLERLPHAIRGVPGAEEGFQPNAVAGCLVLFIPVQVALLTAGRSARDAGRPRLLAEAAMLALTCGTLLLTQSRGAWAGLGVALVSALLWYRPWSRVASLIAIAGVALSAITLGPQRIANLAISQSGPAMVQNISGRTELWSRAVTAIADVPFTGLGMNTFRRVMPTMYPTLLATPELDVAHAHNHLLQAALDLGLPGLVAYLALWLTAARVLWRVYLRTQDGAVRATAGGLAAGLIAHFVFGLADVIPLGSKVGVLFWLSLAMVAALDRVTMAAANDATV